ncbi:MAG: T9SS type A sorting domain-containing protein [Chitinophagales bacterium]|nr:T9SS type A sorting domain-containing protein [Chitinophagales bacterium]MDW8428450.1 T9SS type A sorting domain-containing protein [Chitinophagales bacterium]
MKKPLLVLCAVLLTSWSIAQNLTIRYDATKGVSSLQGETKVYMHSGGSDDAGPLDNTAWEYVVGNWGADDGVGLMTNVGTDLWELNMPDAVAYYSQASNGPVLGNKIYRLGMVFRDAAGNKSGKDNNNDDIFADLSGPTAMVYNKDGTPFDGVVITINSGIGDVKNATFESTVYPNPLSSAGMVAYTLNQPAEQIIIRLYDATGRVMDEYVQGARGLGTYLVHFDATHLAEGVYAYQIAVDGQVKGGTFVVVR